jgi:hypothetical protein
VENNEREWSTAADINGRTLMFSVAITAWLPECDENGDIVYVPFSDEDAKRIIIETLYNMLVTIKENTYGAR